MNKYLIIRYDEFTGITTFFNRKLNKWSAFPYKSYCYNNYDSALIAVGKCHFLDGNSSRFCYSIMTLRYLN